MATQIRVISQDDGRVVYLDLEDDQPITANFQFKDIQTFKDTKGSHTFNFRIPSTTKNNMFFDQYFEVTSFGNFNPAKKVSCTIVKDTIEILNGDLQLTNVIRSNRKMTHYECVVFNSVASIGQALKGKYLTEFNWSELNHTKSMSNVAKSWGSNDATNLKQGNVRYSLFDYGQTPFYGGDLEGSIQTREGAINVNTLIPQVKVKKILDIILGQSGFEYTSDFFTTGISDGTKLFVDANNGGEGTTPTNNQYYNVVTYDGTAFTRVQTITTERFVTIINTNTSSADYTNDAGLYNHTTGVYTIPSSGFSSFDASTNLTFTTSESTNFGTFAPYTGAEIYVSLMYIDQDGNDREYAQSRKTKLETANQIAGTSGNYYTGVVEFPPTTISVPLNVTDYYFRFNVNGDYFIASTGTEIYLNRVKTSFKPRIGYFGNKYSEFNGDLEVNFKYAFPKIKALDFLTSLAKKFNLVIIADRLEPRKLLIEPYKDWIGQGNDLDWTGKLDESKDVQFKPTSHIQSKELVFTDDKSSDNMNALFEKSAGREYGSVYIDNAQNDFSTGKTEVKTIFKPVVTTYIPYTTLKGCICYEGEGESTKNSEGMRLSYWNGFSFADNGSDSFYLTDNFEGTNPSVYALYPQFSNYSSSSITSLTRCLTFTGENSGELDGPSIYGGTYNTYWKTFLEETYSRDSRLLIAHFNLSSVDIMTLNFNDVVKVENEFYRINKIQNYSLIGQSTCKVELIKAQATNIIDSDGNECNVQVKSFSSGGHVNFINTRTGLPEVVTQECCEAFGYEYLSTNSTCYSRSVTPIDISAPSVSVIHASDYDVGSSGTGLFTFANGIGNTLTDHALINGAGNDVRPSPKSIEINGSRNNVSGSVRNARIDGDNSEINPPRLQRKDVVLGVDKYISINQTFRNVKTKGDNAFAISSNSEFTTPAPKDLGTFYPFVSGKGSISSQGLVVANGYAHFGQDGTFAHYATPPTDPYASYNQQGNNYIQIPYPSLMKGELRLFATPTSIDESDEYVDETYEFEVNNQTSSLTPVTSLTAVTGKSNSTAGYSGLTISLEAAITKGYFEGTNYKVVNDGMFALKVDQAGTSITSPSQYNVEFDYKLINSKSRQRSFDPASITSQTLSLWMDANDLSTITYSSGTTISSWTDKSNRFTNNSFTQLNSTGANATTGTFSNGMKHVYLPFYAILGNFNSSIYNLLNNSNCTAFIVSQMQPRSGPAPNRGELIFGTGYTTPSGGFTNDAQLPYGIGYDSTSFHNGSYSGPTPYYASLDDVDPNDLQVNIGERNFNVSSPSFDQKITDQDGNTDSNFNATTNGYTPQLCMGGLKYFTTTGSLWHGKICEVLLYSSTTPNATLTTQEKDDIINYLKSKWQIT